MKRVFRTILLASFILVGNGAVANPQDDAAFIVDRQLSPVMLDVVREAVGRAFVFAYSKPMLRLSIDVADEDQFLELIPEEDIAPYVVRYRERLIEVYLSVYSTDQLAAMSAFLRADEEAMVEDLFSEEYLQKYEIALDQARANTEPSLSDDSGVRELEEFVAHLDASAQAFRDSTDDFALSLHIAFAFLFIPAGYTAEIKRYEYEMNHPVTVAALKAEGVFNFANPVQRQTLLRQTSNSESTGGIQFIQPPSRTED